MSDSSRRTFIRTGTACGAALAVVPSAVAKAGIERANIPTADSKISIARSENFTIEVKGMYGKVPGVLSFDPGKVSMTTKQVTDRRGRTRTTYGEHKYEPAVLSVMQAPGMAKLQEWADRAMKVGGSGDALRRDISLYIKARDKSTVLRTINCFGCYPISLESVDHDTGSDIKTITLTLNVDRIEVA
jgi:hypothetical protein